MRLLFAQNVPDVLAVLILDPETAVHQSKIVETSGLQRKQVQRALQRLYEEGLIEQCKQGNMVYYKLCENHPLMPDLKSILYKTILLAEPLKAALKDYAEEINFAFIYGSIASGTETAESDIDLFIVGKLGLKKVSTLLSRISKQLQREINPVVYSKAEFIKEISQKDHFVSSVLESKKIWIIGGEDELREMETRE